MQKMKRQMNKAREIRRIKAALQADGVADPKPSEVYERYPEEWKTDQERDIGYWIWPASDVE